MTIFTFRIRTWPLYPSQCTFLTQEFVSCTLAGASCRHSSAGLSVCLPWCFFYTVCWHSACGLVRSAVKYSHLPHRQVLSVEQPLPVKNFVSARKLLQYFRLLAKTFRYISRHIYNYFFSVFQNCYVFIPLFLTEPLTMSCGTLFEKHWHKSTILNASRWRRFFSVTPLLFTQFKSVFCLPSEHFLSRSSVRTAMVTTRSESHVGL